MRWLSWSIVLALVAGGELFGSEAAAGRGIEPDAASGRSVSASGHGPRVPSEPAPRPRRLSSQDLTPFVADRVGAVDGHVFRARNGFTLMVIATGWPRDWTRYQVFDRRWRPRTPILQVPARLEMARGVRRGFLGEATVSEEHGETQSRAWVRMGLDGSVSRLPRLGGAQRLRRGDLLFGSSLRRLRGYRPEERRVFVPRLPATDTGSRRDWQMEQDGSFCHPPRRTRSTRPTTWSPGDGHAGRQVRLARLMPPGAYATVRWCWARQGRLVVLTDGGGGDRDDLIKVHTIDPRRRTATSYRPDRRFNPYQYDVLGDGRMVFGTDRPGLMVATDATNTGFELRAGPVRVNQLFTVLGGSVIVVSDSRGRTFRVSPDAGRTWRTIVLRPGPLPPH